MPVITQDPRSPEGVAALKQEGLVLLEVTRKQLYLLKGAKPALAATMKDWFIRYNGLPNAFRDGSHMVGGDKVQCVTNLTDGGSVVLCRIDVAKAEGDLAGYAAVSKSGGFKPDNPYWSTEWASAWDKGYSEGFTRGHAEQFEDSCDA